MPQTTPYHHAFDYLRELCGDDKTPAWLAALISEAVASGFSIGDEAFARLVEDFISGKFTSENPPVGFPPSGPTASSNQPILLSKLIHKSGVNALKSNCELKFGKEVTVVFGRNGSGKSGYFRILNGARSGGSQPQILPNVYSNTVEATPIDVVFEYQRGTQAATIAWNGTTPVQTFSGMMVFNQEYAGQLIQKRGISSAALAPLGLHVFADLTKAVDVFKEKLGKRLEELKQQYPTVQDQILANDFLSRIQNGSMPLEEFREALQAATFTQAEAIELEEKQKELSNLAKTDPTDTMRLKQNAHVDLTSLSAYVTSTYSMVQTNWADWNATLDAYQKASRNAEQARIQYRALASIPGSDTQIWKTFIQSAAAYRQQQGEKESEICPYCRQPIRDETTVELLKCYGAFLMDESQVAFELAQNRLKLIQHRLNSQRGGHPLSESLKQELAHHATGDKSCLEEYEDWLRQINSMEEKLAIHSKEMQCVGDIVPDGHQLLESLQNCDRKLLEEVNRLNEDDDARKKRMAVLEGEIKALELRQRMDWHRSEIQAWMAYHQFLQDTKNNIERISSARVSKMAKRAHNELLTENLRKKFAARYKQFKLGWTKVVLKVAEANKGETKTELVLENSRPCAVDDILSEGEQKAVALAMFLTEADMNPELGPLVFDDPVTSLDNGVIEAFVHMLMGIDRQVVVFTHNQYFLDCLQKEDGAHLCKNFQNGCSDKKGKHILLWEVQRHRGETGVAFPGKGTCAKDLVRDVRAKLGREPCSGSYSEEALLLRKAIEKLIDEKLLHGIIPCRCNPGHNRIKWQDMKELNPSEDYQQLLQTLRMDYSRLSNGDVHESATSIENPLSFDELDGICQELAGICGI